MNLIDVPRNNIKAARRYYEANKPLTGDEVRTLAMLQDDPAELYEVIEREGWNIQHGETDDE